MQAEARGTVAQRRIGTREHRHTRPAHSAHQSESLLEQRPADFVRVGRNPRRHLKDLRDEPAQRVGKLLGERIARQRAGGPERDFVCRDQRGHDPGAVADESREERRQIARSAPAQHALNREARRQRERFRGGAVNRDQQQVLEAADPGIGSLGGGDGARHVPGHPETPLARGPRGGKVDRGGHLAVELDHVHPRPGTTRLPAGTGVEDAGPTGRMRLPRTTTV